MIRRCAVQRRRRLLPFEHLCLVAPLLLLFAFSSAAVALDAEQAAAESPVDFNRDVRPIFAQKCIACHGPDEAEGGLRLTRRAEALAELDSGERAIVPADPDASELLRRVLTDDAELRMPLDADPLPPEEIDVLRRWVAAGAKWDEHWAYRPIERVTPAAVDGDRWPTSAIDRFVLAVLQARDIRPSPEADRHTLIKRLCYDLIGLPPSLGEVDRFVADDAPDAYQRLVDRLLASPHFGERWGRHWLDNARYADSDGYEKDNIRPNAWRYRDWVIDAINADLPFDRFTTEQLAGDLLPDAGELQKLATALNRQTLTNTEGGTDQEQWRVAAVMDRTETLGAVWLGLTVGCARCHTHKYDQISHQEYYRLFAFFNNGDETETVVPVSPAAEDKYRAEKPNYDARLGELETKLAGAREMISARQVEWEQGLKDADADTLKKLPKEIQEILSATDPSNERTDKQRQALASYYEKSVDVKTSPVVKQIDKLKKQAPAPATMKVRVISQRVKDPRTSHILRRGEFKEPLDEVQPGTLATLPIATPRNEGGAVDRLDLARWLTSGENPLPPRVAVNQVWAHLFGEGLVRTKGDFGVRGERPTHPELLDWLAAELIRRGWSRKELIRQIVNSSTYRQASHHRPELVDIDPDNKLLYRQNRFRVEAETVRDVSLAAGGLLSRTIGGPSVFPPMPSEVAALTYNSSFQWKTSAGGDQFRRGMYTFFKRTAPHPNLMTFDCPDSNVTCVERQRSNTPLAALTTLNNGVFVEAARALAGRVLAAGLADDSQRIARAFRLCVARPPAQRELDALAGLLDESRSYYLAHPDLAGQMAGGALRDGQSAEETAAWVAVTRIIMNLDEFITRE